MHIFCPHPYITTAIVPQLSRLKFKLRASGRSTRWMSLMEKRAVRDYTWKVEAKYLMDIVAFGWIRSAAKQKSHFSPLLHVKSQSYCLAKSKLRNVQRNNNSDAFFTKIKIGFAAILSSCFLMRFDVIIVILLHYIILLYYIIILHCH